MSGAESRSARVACGAIGTAIFFILYYALDRSRAAIINPGVDPALVLAAGRIDYFWRVSIASYLAPLAFTGVYFAAGRDPQVWLRRLTRSIIPSVLTGGLLALLFP